MVKLDRDEILKRTRFKSTLNQAEHDGLFGRFLAIAD
jgi:hypothetical protein